jgi:hypothetical protein
VINIDCCEHCVAPKRHLYCHSHCEEYLRQRAEGEQRLVKKAAKMAVEDYFIDQKIKSVQAHLQKQKKMGK